MPINWMPTSADYLRFLPEIILTVVGTLLMVLDAISERRGSPFYGNITIGALLAAAPAQALDWALAGGDDYELLLAVAPARFAELAGAAAACGHGLTAIGRLDHGTGVTWSMNGRPFTPAVRGFDHFR